MTLLVTHDEWEHVIFTDNIRMATHGCKQIAAYRLHVQPSTNVNDNIPKLTNVRRQVTIVIYTRNGTIEIVETEAEGPIDTESNVEKTDISPTDFVNGKF